MFQFKLYIKGTDVLKKLAPPSKATLKQSVQTIKNMTLMKGKIQFYNIKRTHHHHNIEKKLLPLIKKTHTHGIYIYNILSLHKIIYQTFILDANKRPLNPKRKNSLYDITLMHVSKMRMSLVGDYDKCFIITPLVNCFRKKHIIMRSTFTIKSIFMLTIER